MNYRLFAKETKCELSRKYSGPAQDWEFKSLIDFFLLFAVLDISLKGCHLWRSFPVVRSRPEIPYADSLVTVSTVSSFPLIGSMEGGANLLFWLNGAQEAQCPFLRCQETMISPSSALFSSGGAVVAQET